VGDYSPRRIYRRVQTGGDLFESPDLWQCTTCMNCLRVCPKEVDMMQIMPAVREQAVLNGYVPDELQEVLEHGGLWQPDGRVAEEAPRLDEEGGC
jgi:heterodisulfide reductase subunit C